MDNTILELARVLEPDPKARVAKLGGENRIPAKIYLSLLIAAQKEVSSYPPPEFAPESLREEWS